MHSRVEIDRALLDEAMKVGGFLTAEAAVEAALRQMIRSVAQRQALQDLHGIGWEGDLDKMRNDWTPAVDGGCKTKSSQPVRRFAVTSISTFISGLLSWQTIMVAAGLISPNTSPRIGNTTSTKSRSVM